MNSKQAGYIENLMKIDPKLSELKTELFKLIEEKNIIHMNLKLDFNRIHLQLEELSKQRRELENERNEIRQNNLIEIKKINQEINIQNNKINQRKKIIYKDNIE